MKKLLIAINVIGLLLITIHNSVIAEATESDGVVSVSQLNDINPNDDVYLQGRLGLIALADFVNRGSGLETSGVTFVLLPDNNNTVDGSGLTTIGYQDGENPKGYFGGSFIGSGVVIENLSVLPFENRDGVGLFGHTVGAILEDITISGVRIIHPDRGFIGSLIGDARFTTIQNVHVVGDITIHGFDRLGSLIGFGQDSTVLRSSVQANNLFISGASKLGGLVGDLTTDSIIDQSFIQASNIGLFGKTDSDGLGGMVGQLLSSSTISNSYVNTPILVIQGRNYLGGVAGVILTESEIHNVYLSVSGLQILGDQFVGGFAGSLNTNNVNINNSFLATNTLLTSGNTNVGMFIGGRFNNAGTITNSFYNSGVLDGEWIEYPNPTGSGIATITGTTLLDIVNGDDAFEQRFAFGFPRLFNLEEQTLTNLYWEIGLPFQTVEELEAHILVTDVFNIADVSGLHALRDFVFRGSGTQGLSFALTDDIYLTDDAWLPIGSYGFSGGSFEYNENGSFDGTFIGNGHTIYDMTLDDSGLIATNDLDFEQLGFFGVLGSGAQILDVTFSDARFELTSTSGFRGIGVLAGVAIDNIFISGVTVVDPIIDLSNNGDANITEIGGLVGVVDVDNLAILHSHVIFSGLSSRFSITTSEAEMSNIGGFIGAVFAYSVVDMQNNSVVIQSRSGVSIINSSGVIGEIGLAIGQMEVYSDALLLNNGFITNFKIEVADTSIEMSSSSGLILQSSLGIGVTAGGFDFQDISLTVVDSQVSMRAQQLQSVGLLHGIIDVGFLSSGMVTIQSSDIVFEAEYQMNNVGLWAGVITNSFFNHLMISLDQSTVLFDSKSLDESNTHATGLLVGQLVYSFLLDVVFVESESDITIDIQRVGRANGGLFGLSLMSQFYDSAFQLSSPLKLNLDEDVNNQFPAYYGGVIGDVFGITINNALFDIHLDFNNTSGIDMGGFGGILSDNLIFLFDEFAPVDDFTPETGFLDFVLQGIGGGTDLETFLLLLELFESPLIIDQAVFQIEISGLEEYQKVFSLFALVLFEDLARNGFFFFDDDDGLFPDGNQEEFIKQQELLRALTSVYFIDELYSFTTTEVDEFILDLITEFDFTMEESSGLIDKAETLALSKFEFGLVTVLARDFLTLLGANDDIGNPFDVLIDSFIQAVYGDDGVSNSGIILDDWELFADVLFPKSSVSSSLMIPVIHQLDGSGLTFVEDTLSSGLTVFKDFYIYESLLDLSMVDYERPEMSGIEPLPQFFTNDFVSLSNVISSSGILSEPFVFEDDSRLPQHRDFDYTPTIIANHPVTLPEETIEVSVTIDGLTPSSITALDEFDSQFNAFTSGLNQDTVTTSPPPENFNATNEWPTTWERSVYYYSGLTLFRQDFTVQYNWIETASATPPANNPVTRVLRLDVTPLEQTIEEGSVYTPPTVVAEEVFGFIKTNRRENVTTTGTVNSNVVGTYEVVYRLAVAGLTTVTQTMVVTVVDTTPPVIQMNPSYTFLLGTAIEIPFTLTDNAVGDITSSWDEPFPEEPGTHQRTLTATDRSGNVSTKLVDIIIRLPRVVSEVVSVNEVSVVFRMEEGLFDIDNYEIEVAVVADTTQEAALDWQPYQALITLEPGERVYASLIDANGVRLVRELPQVQRLQAEPPLMEIPIIEPSTSNPLSTPAIVIQTMAGITSVSAVAWLSYTTFRTPNVLSSNTVTRSVSKPAKKPSSTSKMTRTTTAKKSTNKTTKTTTLQTKKPRK